MTTNSSMLIAIPMKDPSASKTRLVNCLSDQERQDLALALFKRTLDVIERSGCDVDVLVVTESAWIESLCKGRAISVLWETQSSGLNAACDRAARWAVKHRYAKMAVLPADLALLSENEISRLVQLHLQPGQIALCEATDGGTNCLLASPPDAIPYRYGPDSFRAHRREAMRTGLGCFILRDSDMRYDIDTSQDLQYLRALRQNDGSSA